jgi:hypothetical protein
LLRGLFRDGLFLCFSDIRDIMINYKNDKESGASSKSEAFTASGTY